MRLHYHNTIFTKYIELTEQQLRDKSKYYYDAKSVTLERITSIEITKKRSFFHLLINGKYKHKTSFSRYAPTALMLNYNDAAVPIYSSTESFARDAQEKFKTARRTYQAALKTVKNYENTDTAISKIYEEYPEYFI